MVSRVRKSARHEQLEQAFDTPSALADDYADQIVCIVRQAQAAGVDIEADLRNRLREIEQDITRLEQTGDDEDQ